MDCNFFMDMPEFEKKERYKEMKKNERQKIKKTLINVKLYKVEGSLDEFIKLLTRAKEEAKREGFNVVTVDFGIGVDEEDYDFPYMEVEASRLETVAEMKIRESAEKARKERESKEQYEAVMEEYKNHD